MESHFNEIVQAAKKIYNKGLVTANIGNISCRVGNKVMISALGAPLDSLDKDDNLVIIDLNGNKLEGEKEPSSERLMHLNLYNSREDVGAVIHTHSTYASTFGYLKKEIYPVNPESEYLLQKVPIVPPFMYGTKELADSVKKHLKEGKAALLSGHGVVTVGKDLREAVYIAELIEEAAKINYLVATLKASEKR
jgi:L-fuculose-phosphate aldolase